MPLEHEKYVITFKFVSTDTTYWFTDLIGQAVRVWYQHAQHWFHHVLFKDYFLVLIIFLLIDKKVILIHVSVINVG